MFYTRSNGVRVPATVVGFAPDGLVHLEYFRDPAKVVNHIPTSIWTEEEAPEVDEEEEDAFLCQVCGKRDTSECSTCDLYLCRGCMGEHTCDIDVPE